MPNVTTTTLIFDAERYDYGSHYDASTYTFTAPYDGIYSFSLTAGFDALNDGDYMILFLSKNGFNYRLSWQMQGTTASRVLETVSMDIQLDAGDTVQPKIYHNYGSNRNTTGGSDWTNFSGHLVGRTD